MEKLILASSSPRREELLRLLTTAFVILPSGADETLPPALPPEEAVTLLALRKARVVAQKESAWVLGADTVVTIDGLLLGKPSDERDAARMLELLSGRVHRVCTGVALCRGREEHTFQVATAVEFAPLSQEEIAWYLSTKEPFDKAGAYGIQGFGARFVRRIEGDYYNVMGLPIQRLYEELKKCGLALQ